MNAYKFLLFSSMVGLVSCGSSFALEAINLNNVKIKPSINNTQAEFNAVIKRNTKTNAVSDYKINYIRKGKVLSSRRICKGFNAQNLYQCQGSTNIVLPKDGYKKGDNYIIIDGDGDKSKRFNATNLYYDANINLRAANLNYKHNNDWVHLSIAVNFPNLTTENKIKAKSISYICSRDNTIKYIHKFTQANPTYTRIPMNLNSENVKKLFTNPKSCSDFYIELEDKNGDPITEANTGNIPLNYMIALSIKNSNLQQIIMIDGGQDHDGYHYIYNNNYATLTLDIDINHLAEHNVPSYFANLMRQNALYGLKISFCKESDGSNGCTEESQNKTTVSDIDPYGFLSYDYPNQTTGKDKKKNDAIVLTHKYLTTKENADTKFTVCYRNDENNEQLSTNNCSSWNSASAVLVKEEKHYNNSDYKCMNGGNDSHSLASFFAVEVAECYWTNSDVKTSPFISIKSSVGGDTPLSTYVDNFSNSDTQGSTLFTVIEKDNLHRSSANGEASHRVCVQGSGCEDISYQYNLSSWKNYTDNWEFGSVGCSKGHIVTCDYNNKKIYTHHQVSDVSAYTQHELVIQSAEIPTENGIKNGSDRIKKEYIISAYDYTGNKVTTEYTSFKF